jgi:uncharacterized Zn-binding protein involved in type VI secretion
LSGNLLYAGATISCPHGGRASAAAGLSGVLLDGMPVPTVGTTYPVTGCPYMVGGMPRPCTSVRWRAGTPSVLIDGVPALAEGCAAECFTDDLIPQGTPHVAAVQQGVVCR